MIAGTRPWARSSLAPARRASFRGDALNGTEFMVCKLSLFVGPSGVLVGSAAFEFKQRGHRRITMDSLDGFAQKAGYRQSGYLHSADGRAKDSISCDQFVNTRFSQSGDADFVQNGVGDAGQDFLCAFAFKQFCRSG